MAGIEVIRNLDEGKLIKLDNYYSAYVPFNCDYFTGATLFYPGIDNTIKTTNEIVDYIKNTCPNEVIIFSNIYNAYHFDNVMSYFDQIQEEEGITFSNYNTFGFSGGGVTSVHFLDYLIRNNEDLPPQNLVLIEASVESWGSDILNETVVENLLKNKTAVFVIDENGRNSTFKSVEELARQGVPVIRFYIDGYEYDENGNIKYNNGKAIYNGPTHGGVNEDTLNNDIIQYIKGMKDLNDPGRYQVTIFNPETNQWEEISYDEIYEKYISRSVISDSEFLNLSLDMITIALNEALNVNTPSVSFSSTTKVPIIERSIIKDLCEGIKQLSFKLSNEVLEMRSAGKSIDTLNQELVGIAEQLNDDVRRITEIRFNEPHNVKNLYDESGMNINSD